MDSNITEAGSQNELLDGTQTTGSQQKPNSGGSPEQTADQAYQQNVAITAKGGMVSLIGRISEYLLRFAFSVIVARWIGAEQYGLYTLSLTVAPIVSTFALLGLQTGIVHFLPPAIREQDKSRILGILQISIGLPIVLSIIFGAVLYLLSGQIAVSWFHDERLISLLQIVAISVPIEALSFLVYQIIISYKAPRYSVIASNIFLPLTKLLLSVWFLQLGMGVRGVVIAHVLSLGLSLALFIFFANKFLKIKDLFHSAKRNTRALLRYSLPVHFAYVFNILRGSLETLILGFVGLTTDVGIYSVALRLSTLGNMVYLAIGNISTPIMAELHHRGEKAQLKSFYQTTARWILTLNTPLFLTFVIFSKPILSIFGSDFTEGSDGLMVLTLGSLVYTGTGLGANILDMTDHTRLNSINSAIMVVVTIAMDLLLIPRWGILGAATAASFSTVIVNLICMVEVFFLHKMLPYDRSIFKLLTAAVISAGLTTLIMQYISLSPILYLITGTAILWALYMLALVALGLSPQDRMLLAGFAARLRRRTADSPAVQ